MQEFEKQIYSWKKALKTALLTFRETRLRRIVITCVMSEPLGQCQTPISVPRYYSRSRQSKYYYMESAGLQARSPTDRRSLRGKGLKFGCYASLLVDCYCGGFGG